MCEKVGANVSDVSIGIGLDGRIGKKFLHPGPGYGGSCFPKDTLAFVKTGRDLGAPQSIVEKVIEVNTNVKLRMIDKILGLFDSISGKVISIFGVTFKPNTDDIRESPSLTIIPALIERKAIVRIIDPQAHKNCNSFFKSARWYSDCYECAEGSDLIVIITEWNEFRALDLAKLSRKMRTPQMADLRNIYSQEKILDHGFIKYVGVGR